MSGEGQNVYPVEKLCAGWVCPILRDTHLPRQHLVVLATRCDQGNTQQVSGAWRYTTFTDGLCACEPLWDATERCCEHETDSNRFGCVGRRTCPGSCTRYLHTRRYGGVRRLGLDGGDGFQPLGRAPHLRRPSGGTHGDAAGGPGAEVGVGDLWVRAARKLCKRRGAVPAGTRRGGSDHLGNRPVAPCGRNAPDRGHCSGGTGSGLRKQTRRNRAGDGWQGNLWWITVPVGCRSGGWGGPDGPCDRLSSARGTLCLARPATGQLHRAGRALPCRQDRRHLCQCRNAGRPDWRVAPNAGLSGSERGYFRASCHARGALRNASTSVRVLSSNAP